MTKYVYTPTDPEDARPCTVFGIEFTPGQAVEVKSKTALAKLANNPEFTEDGKDPAAVRAARAAAREAAQAEE